MCGASSVTTTQMYTFLPSLPLRGMVTACVGPPSGPQLRSDSVTVPEVGSDHPIYSVAAWASGKFFPETVAEVPALTSWAVVICAGIRLGPACRAALNITGAGLAPNSMYEFSVRDQDLLTETPFSAPIAATTLATNLIQLSLVPVAGGTETPVGTASLTATGNFSAPINIPLSQPPGMYNLTAVLPGIAPVSTELQVVAAGQPLPPSIQVVGVQPPATAFLTGGVPFTVSFEGFLPGTVSVFVDSPAGQLIGTAASSGPGSFTAPFGWPFNVSGAHSLYAQETVGAQTLTAPPCPVFGQQTQ